MCHSKIRNGDNEGYSGYGFGDKLARRFFTAATPAWKSKLLTRSRGSRSASSLEKPRRVSKHRAKSMRFTAEGGSCNVVVGSPWPELLLLLSSRKKRRRESVSRRIRDFLHLFNFFQPSNSFFFYLYFVYHFHISTLFNLDSRERISFQYSVAHFR